MDNATRVKVVSEIDMHVAILPAGIISWTQYDKTPHFLLVCFLLPRIPT